MFLTPDIEKCRSILKETQLAHFNIPNWARHLLPLSKELGLKISCDIQDVTDISDPYRAEFINYADVLFLSSVNHADPKPMLKEIIKKHPHKIVISGMGADGCAVGTKDGIEYFEAVELPGIIVDTNGAGDGLAVGFLSGYIFERFGIKKSILRAQIVARYTCTLKATTSNLISQNTLQKLLTG